MKKIFLSTAAILILIFPAITFAAPTTPTQSVWSTPAHPKKGEAVELNALVFNGTSKTATVTVVFSVGEEEATTATITIAPQTAKVAVGAWEAPAEAVEVVATVTKAEDASKKDIPQLVGVVGSVKVGGASTLNLDFLGDGAKTWFSRITTEIEPWRIKKAEYFSTLKQKKKDQLGIEKVQDITSRYEPNVPDIAGGSGQEIVTEGGTSSSNVPIGDYAVLLYATALAAIFSSATVFYITAIVLAFGVLRFLFRLFS